MSHAAELQAHLKDNPDSLTPALSMLYSTRFDSAFRADKLFYGDELLADVDVFPFEDGSFLGVSYRDDFALFITGQMADLMPMRVQ